MRGVEGSNELKNVPAEKVGMFFFVALFGTLSGERSLSEKWERKIRVKRKNLNLS